MTLSPLEVAIEANRLWQIGEDDRSFELVHQEAVYSLNIAETLLSFGGEKVGWTEFREAFRQMREQFDYLLYRPMNYNVNGKHVTNQVEFMLRHRQSGHVLSGRFRSVWTVEDGMVRRLDEYVDAALIEVFLKLAGSGESETPEVTPDSGYRRLEPSS